MIHVSIGNASVKPRENRRIQSAILSPTPGICVSAFLLPDKGVFLMTLKRIHLHDRWRFLCILPETPSLTGKSSRSDLTRQDSEMNTLRIRSTQSFSQKILTAFRDLILSWGYLPPRSREKILSIPTGPVAQCAGHDIFDSLSDVRVFLYLFQDCLVRFVEGKIMCQKLLINTLKF